MPYRACILLPSLLLLLRQLLLLLPVLTLLLLLPVLLLRLLLLLLLEQMDWWRCGWRSWLMDVLLLLSLLLLLLLMQRPSAIPSASLVAHCSCCLAFASTCLLAAIAFTMAITVWCRDELQGSRIQIKWLQGCRLALAQPLAQCAVCSHARRVKGTMASTRYYLQKRRLQKKPC